MTNMFRINHKSSLKCVLLLCVSVAVFSVNIVTNAAGMALDDPKIEKQVDALLSQMTLDEKIGQMVQVDSAALINKSDIATYFLGSVLSGGNSDPPDDNSPKSWLKFATGFEAYASQTRLKIPIIYGIDAVHGHNNIDGAVIFPHNIGMGATRNPALVEKAAQVVREEVAGTGIRWTFAPCVAVA